VGRHRWKGRRGRDLVGSAQPRPRSAPEACAGVQVTPAGGRHGTRRSTIRRDRASGIRRRSATRPDPRRPEERTQGAGAIPEVWNAASATVVTPLPGDPKPTPKNTAQSPQRQIVCHRPRQNRGDGCAHSSLISSFLLARQPEAARPRAAISCARGRLAAARGSPTTISVGRRGAIATRRYMPDLHPYLSPTPSLSRHPDHASR